MHGKGAKYIVYLLFLAFIAFCCGKPGLLFAAMHFLVLLLSSRSLPKICNKLVPIVTVLMVSAEFGLFAYYIFGLKQRIVSGIALTLSFWSFVQSSRANPGCVSQDSKPGNAQYCKESDSYVIGKVHYCVWIQNCVGYCNHRFFMLTISYASVAYIVAMWTVYWNALRVNKTTLFQMAAYSVIFDGVYIVLLWFSHLHIFLKRQTATEVLAKKGNRKDKQPAFKLTSLLPIGAPEAKDGITEGIDVSVEPGSRSGKVLEFISLTPIADETVAVCNDVKTAVTAQFRAKSTFRVAQAAAKFMKPLANKLKAKQNGKQQ